MVTNYAKKRYITYFIATIVTLVLPWIKINGNHIFLLSFDHKKLNLFFTSFDMQELYLMPFVVILFFIGVLFLTTLGGRIWCGWACPQTVFRVIYRDFLQTKVLRIRKSIKHKEKEIEGQYFQRTIAVIILFCLALVAASNFLWFAVPPEDFFEYLKNPHEHKLLFGIVVITALFFTFDIAVLGEKFCVYVCPYARIQSTMFDQDTIQIIYDENRGGKVYDGANKLEKRGDGDCVGCESCVHICPAHIDIRRGMQLECIHCLECADACSGVMARLKKPSLISWTSPNALQNSQKVKYFRFRTIAYMVVITITMIALGFMSTKKENMLLNIGTTTELYKVSNTNDGFKVANHYTFLIQNTDLQDHEYYFEVLNPKIKIDRPLEPIQLKAGSKRKLIVSLSTNEFLVKDETRDTPLNLTIKAFAIDNKEITVERKTIFVFPKISEITKVLRN